METVEIIAPETVGAEPCESVGETRPFDPRTNLRPKPWKKGQSGNPTGRPKRNADAMKTARDYAQSAVAMLWKLASDPKIPAEVRRKACNDLLDRGFGKVTKTIAIKPGEAPEQSPEHDSLADEMQRFIGQAGTKQEVLPPLDDPFAVDDTRQLNGDIRQTTGVERVERGTGNHQEQEKRNIRDAFSLGAIIGQELSEDDD